MPDRGAYCCPRRRRPPPLDAGGRAAPGRPRSGRGRRGRMDRPPYLAPPNSRSREARWLAPRPRTRRDSAMLSRSMICLARTLPTPGSDSSRAETFILPMTSSVWPSASTSDRETPPCFRRFLTSARSFLALAAFSRAAARCSGVRGGRATPGHLGFLSFVEGGRLRKLVGSDPVRQRKVALRALIERQFIQLITLCLRSIALRG